MKWFCVATGGKRYTVWSSVWNDGYCKRTHSKWKTFSKYIAFFGWWSLEISILRYFLFAFLRFSLKKVTFNCITDLPSLSVSSRSSLFFLFHSGFPPFSQLSTKFLDACFLHKITRFLCFHILMACHAHPL